MGFKVKNIEQYYRMLLIQGCTNLEAGNKIAKFLGLEESTKYPWTHHELNAVLFMRDLHRHIER